MAPKRKRKAASSSEIDLPKVYGFLCKTNNNEFEYICESCRSTFITGTELESHVKDTHETPLKNENKIQQLPLEMMEKIYKNLHPNDLAALSRTCKMQKLWTEQYYKSHFKQELMMITENRQTSNMKFDKWEKHQIRFRELFPDLQVNFVTKSAIDKVFQFIKENCAKQLRYLYFDCAKLIKIVPNVADLLIDQIKNLEILETRNILDVENLIKRCNNLKMLTIKNSLGSSTVVTMHESVWSNLVIPSLEILVLSVHGRRQDGELSMRKILENHPQLKKIVCDRNEEAINSILTSQNNLSYVGIAVKDFSLIQFNLEAASQQNHIEEIDLKLNFDFNTQLRNMNSIANYRFIKSLHYSISIFEIPLLVIQPHVERVCCGTSFTDPNMIINAFSQCYPNLRELRLHVYSTMMVDILRKLIVGLKKIEHLFVKIGRGSQWNFRNDLITTNLANELHLIRLNSENPSRVNIHIDEKYSTLTLPSQDETQLISFDNDYFDCPMCMLSWSNGEKWNSLLFQKYLKIV